MATLKTAPPPFPTRPRARVKSKVRGNIRVNDRDNAMASVMVSVMVSVSVKDWVGRGAAQDEAAPIQPPNQSNAYLSKMTETTRVLSSLPAPNLTTNKPA